MDKTITSQNTTTGEDLEHPSVKELPSVTKFILDTFKGGSVITDCDHQVFLPMFGTKITLVGTEGWEHLERDEKTTLQDICAYPHLVVQEIDIEDLLEKYLKLVGPLNFHQQFPPKQQKKKVDDGVSVWSSYPDAPVIIDCSK